MTKHGGGTTVALALTLTLMLGFAALVIDISYERMVRAELEAAADAGALAGARALNQNSVSLTASRDAAIEVAGLNYAAGSAVTVSSNPSNSPSGGVVTGIWNGSSFSASTDTRVVNAVSVLTYPRAYSSGLSSAAFGLSPRSVHGRSVAVQGQRHGASRVPYYLPFALPKCEMLRWTGSQLVAKTWVLNPATADNVGWASLGNVVSAAGLISQLRALVPCMHAWRDTGTVSTACSSIRISDTVALNNGDQASVLRELATLVPNGLNWDSTVWGALPPRNSSSALTAAQYGKTLAGPMPIFDGGNGYCSGSEPWNKTYAVTGFVWAAIYDVRTSGSASNRNIWLKVDPLTYRDIGRWYGGPEIGRAHV